MNSSPSAKVWLTGKYVNRISHRALTKFEIRSPGFYMASLRVHADWSEAHAAIVADRQADLVLARKKTKAAELALKRAEAMRQPTEKTA